MGTGWKYRTKARTRPIKSASERRRRQKVQRNRLVSLGVDQAVADSLQPDDIRALLSRPAELKKLVAENG